MMLNSYRKLTHFAIPLIIAALTLSHVHLCHGQNRQLEPAPRPIGNPLVGLVPYARPVPNRFPHSLEFNYVGLARIVVGPNQYDWTEMESLLDDIASRGNQAVLRVYMEYPGKNDGIPKYLIEQGLKVHSYLNTNTAPFPPEEVSTPDYESTLLREMLRSFIAEFGKRYDADPRIGFITAGLLGTWGEWHTYPRNELWASKETQAIVMDAMEANFKTTPVLLRYPAGEHHFGIAENASRKMGYHDDSLCWATLETGRKEDDWFFVPALKAAGDRAIAKWQTQPIGGEIRPEVWGRIFDKECDIPKSQPFDQCAKELHLSWTMDSGMFRTAPDESRMANALEQVSRIGYCFQATEVTLSPGKDRSKRVQLQVKNIGIAPFYYPWKTEIALWDRDRRSIALSQKLNWDWRGILPGETAVFELDLDVSPVEKGHYELILRIINPLNNGKPLQFANQEWASTVPGWLTLSPVELP